MRKRLEKKNKLISSNIFTSDDWNVQITDGLCLTGYRIGINSLGHVLELTGYVISETFIVYF